MTKFTHDNDYNWSNLEHHIRLLCIHPNVILDLPENHSSCTIAQNDLIELVKKLFNPSGCLCKPSSYALECFITGFHYRYAIGFKYAAVAAYLYCPQPQHFLRQKGLLRSSFMISSKYPHIDHPVTGAIQLPPAFVPDENTVQQYHIAALNGWITSASRIDPKKYAQLKEMKGLLSILKDSQMVLTLLQGEPSQTYSVSLTKQQLDDDYTCLARLVQKEVFKKNTGEKIKPLPSRLSNIINDIVNNITTTIQKLQHICNMRWDIPKETICEKIHMFLGICAAQIVLEIILSRMAQNDAQFNKYKKESDVDIILDEDIKKDDLLLPSPTTHKVLRNGIKCIGLGAKAKLAVAVCKIPKIHMDDPADAILVSLLDEQRCLEAIQEEYTSISPENQKKIIEQHFIKKIMDAFLPLGRTSIETETRYLIALKESSRYLAEEANTIGHTQKNRLTIVGVNLEHIKGNLLQSRVCVQEMLTLVNTAMLFTLSTANSALCANYMADLLHVDCKISSIRSKFLEPHDKPYNLGFKLQEMVRGFNIANRPLTITNTDINMLNDLQIGATIIQGDKKFRLFDAFYDDIFFEILYNATEKSDKQKKLEIRYKRLPWSSDEQLAKYKFVTFTNLTDESDFINRLKLVPEKWTSWSISPDGPNGALRHIAMRLNATNPPQGLLLARPFRSGSKWKFSLAIYIIGLQIQKKGGGE